MVEIIETPERAFFFLLKNRQRYPLRHLDRHLDRHSGKHLDGHLDRHSGKHLDRQATP